MTLYPPQPAPDDDLGRPPDPSDWSPEDWFASGTDDDDEPPDERGRE